MNILITGNKGFVGSALQKRLEKLGHNIHGIDIKDGSQFDLLH